MVRKAFKLITDGVIIIFVRRIALILWSNTNMPVPNKVVLENNIKALMASTGMKQPKPLRGGDIPVIRFMKRITMISNSEGFTI